MKKSIKFAKVHPNAIIPSKREEDGAFDIYACFDEDHIVIKPHETKMIPTGIAIELPHNTEAQVRSRSGLAIKSGIAVVNGIGTIDEDYRGEICVGLINHSKVDFKISRGDRIAQMAIMEVLKPAIVIADDLSDTVRSSGGFGSTGVK